MQKYRQARRERQKQLIGATDREQKDLTPAQILLMMELLFFYQNRLVDVARICGVCYQTVVRWRDRVLAA